MAGQLVAWKEPRKVVNWDANLAAERADDWVSKTAARLAELSVDNLAQHLVDPKVGSRAVVMAAAKAFPKVVN